MHSRLRRQLALTGVTAMMTVLAAAGPAPFAAAAAVPALAAATVPGLASARPAAGQVLLITGDRVLASQGRGGLRARPELPAGSRPGSLTSLVLGGRTYEVPDAAMPYLGRALEPDLFDVSALAGHEQDGRLRVLVSYHGRPPALPGVTITRAAAGVAEGYLTTSSARLFGAALDRQYEADHARASYGADGMFAGRVRISLAGVPAAQASPAGPEYPMHTLTVTATDLAARPDTGDYLIVTNTDDSRLFSDPAEAVSVFYHGVAKFSVPAGHYWAVGEFGAAGLMSVGHVVVLPQFSVTRNTTVHMAERAADSKVTMVTPRPATAQETNFWLLRSGKSGPPVLVGWSNVGTPMRVTPTVRAPTVGTLRAYASQELASPAGPGTRYEYVVSYLDPRGLVTRQRYLVRARQLATVDERFYQAAPSPGQVAFFGSLPDSFAGYVEPDPFPFRMPGRLIAYIGGGMPRMTWATNVAALGRHGYDESGEQGLFQAFPAGEHLTESWGAYPLHPAVNVNPDPHSFLDWLQPSATRSGDTLRLTITPFGDNQPGHLGFGFFPVPGAKITGSYQVDQDGKKIAGGSAIGPGGGAGWFTTRVTLSRKPSVIRFEFGAARTGTAFPLSTVSRTVWTWRSAAEPGVTLPPGWYCYVAGVALNQHCATQPMMTLRYAVARMALDGQVPAGRQVVSLSVGHLPLAAAVPVTRVTVAVSFEGGKTWRTACVTGRRGRYRAVFYAPAGAYVMMRTTAQDAAGGSVAETITRAFRVAS